MVSTLPEVGRGLWWMEAVQVREAYIAGINRGMPDQDMPRPQAGIESGELIEARHPHGFRQAARAVLHESEAHGLRE